MSSANQAPASLAPLVIAVLNWNGYALTRACLESLAHLDGPPHQILVVDNGSDELEAERLAAEFAGQVEALTLPRNLGVGGGYNAAIAWAHARSAQYVLLLNNDTVVEDPHLARRLTEACGPGVLAVGPWVMEPGGRLASAGGQLAWSTAQTSHRQVDAVPTTNAPYPVSWVDGSCMLVSVSAACELEGFDQEFFLYWEEVDLCVRGWRRGLRCLVEPRARIIHLGSQTAQRHQIDDLMLRNSVLFMRRNANWRQNGVFLFHLVTWRIPRLAGRGIRNGRPILETVGMALRSIGWNTRDAWRKRTWRPEARGSLRCTRPAGASDS